MGDTGGAGARVGIVAGMLKGHERRDPQPDGADRVPEPTDRPSDHAQWDEVAAVWTEWDEASGQWVPVSEASREANDNDHA